MQDRPGVAVASVEDLAQLRLSFDIAGFFWSILAGLATLYALGVILVALGHAVYFAVIASEAEARSSIGQDSANFYLAMAFVSAIGFVLLVAIPHLALIGRKVAPYVLGGIAVILVLIIGLRQFEAFLLSIAARPAYWPPAAIVVLGVKAVIDTSELSAFEHAVVRYPVPRRLWGRVKYAVGLPPSAYLSFQRNALSTFVLLVTRYIYFVGILLIYGLVLSWTVFSRTTGPNDPTLTLTAIALCALIGALALTKTANWLRTSLYEKLRRRDRRRPLLYLRPFQDDGQTLLPRWIVTPPGAPRTLEELLGNLAGAYGPFAAFGRPGERFFRPFGAARVYAKNDWQAEVAALASEARFIFVCVRDTDGLKWEVEHLQRGGHLTKSAFLFPPTLAQDRRLAFAEALCGAVPPCRAGEKLICLAKGHDGGWHAATARSSTTPAYHCAVMGVLLYQFGYPDGAFARPKLVNN